MKIERIHSVDILRGLLAVGVMLYHYSYWLGLRVPQPFLSISHKVGIYAVEGFFVLSGFSLYWAYRNRPPLEIGSFTAFIITRILRLAPLFIAAILLNKDIKLSQTPLETLLANFTLTLGFFDSSKSLVVGGWSIGVEVVLSVLLPAALLFQVKMRHAFLALFALSCVPLYFWQGQEAYPQAPNHLAFFTAGIYFGFLRENGFKLSPSIFWVVLVLLLISFNAIDCNAKNWPELVNGSNRALLTTLTLGITGLFCLYEFKKPRGVFWLLTLLGEASYSVYLLHPLVFQRWRRALEFWPDPYIFIVLAAITVALALLVYRFFEAPILTLKPRSRNQAKPSL